MQYIKRKRRRNKINTCLDIYTLNNKQVDKILMKANTMPQHVEDTSSTRCRVYLILNLFNFQKCESDMYVKCYCFKLFFVVSSNSCDLYQVWYRQPVQPTQHKNRQLQLREIILDTADYEKARKAYITAEGQFYAI